MVFCQITLFAKITHLLTIFGEKCHFYWKFKKRHFSKIFKIVKKILGVKFRNRKTRGSRPRASAFLGRGFFYLQVKNRQGYFNPKFYGKHICRASFFPEKSFGGSKMGETEKTEPQFPVFNKIFNFSRNWGYFSN